jgi:hypothetical protein
VKPPNIPSKLEEFFAYVDAEKPKFIVARFYDGVLVDYAAAETEKEALTIRDQYKQFGGKVDIFIGPRNVGPDTTTLPN